MSRYLTESKMTIDDKMLYRKRFSINKPKLQKLDEKEASILYILRAARLEIGKQVHIMMGYSGYTT